MPHRRSAASTVSPDAPPSSGDVRVAAVLDVLGGQPASVAAYRHGVEPVLLHRWVRSFVEAGTARVTNRPEPDAAHQRDRFLAALAHEVRTPLAVAQGWASLLQDGELEEDEAVSALDRLGSSLEHLAERTREVELLAAASLGRLRLSPRHTTVEEVTDHLPDRGPIGGHGPLVGLHVDPELLGRVLRDLWLVAVRTAPAPTAVRLEVLDGNPWQELRVVREGAPIDPHVLVALFEPFDRNDDATGVTIGLYLARALAVAHGGSIGAQVDDQERELRTVFWLRVPRWAGVDPTHQEER